MEILKQVRAALCMIAWGVGVSGRPPFHHQKRSLSWMILEQMKGAWYHH